MIRARKAKNAVLETGLPNNGSARTLAKLSTPTDVGADTRFVSWTLMTNDRSIGYQENTPKTSSKGSRKASVLSPSLLTRIRLRRRLRSPWTATIGSDGALIAWTSFPRVIFRALPERLMGAREPGPPSHVVDYPLSRMDWTALFAALRSESMLAFLSVSTAW